MGLNQSYPRPSKNLGPTWLIAVFAGEMFMAWLHGAGLTYHQCHQFIMSVANRVTVTERAVPATKLHFVAAHLFLDYVR
ncbi:hypothetical protein BDW60DRAFT_187005 [Aspergillus nidulans var. acristatus]